VFVFLCFVFCVLCFVFCVCVLSFVLSSVLCVLCVVLRERVLPYKHTCCVVAFNLFLTNAGWKMGLLLGIPHLAMPICCVLCVVVCCVLCGVLCDVCCVE